MRELDFDNSLKLLCGHAFGEYEPHHGFEQLSRDILSFTGGIPLALEVIGSYLRGKRLAIWKETSNKLKMVPHDRLYREILMSSYEILNDEEKEIFLDIVFFFSDEDKIIAFYYWEACSLFPETSIDTLISFAMIKIVNTNRFWMHDLLKELGREVVRKQIKGNLGMRSRLCNKDALCFLLGKEGTRHVKALKLDSNCAHNFTSAELLSLSCLRFMELHGGNFVGECKDSSCLSKLLRFSWQNCPVEFRWTNLCFQNLVVLRLLNSNITDTWSGWGQFMTARNLKVLELQGLYLNTTPDLSSFLRLEKLAIRECNNLVHIDPSIANLECLGSLELIRYQWMEMDNDPHESSQDGLHLPNSICNLRALSRLVIEGCKLERLPDSIGELKCLKIMEITNTWSLQNLPDTIGDLESLCELNLSYNAIIELPKSIGKLRRLTKKDVSHNELRRLPATVIDLDRLRVLNVRFNSALEGEIPNEIYKLQSLKSLDLEDTGICRLPAWSVQLSRLESLLGFHDEIQEWTNLPVSLTRLDISSRSLKSIPNLSSLTNLVRLKLSNYDFFERNVGDPWYNPPALTENIMTWIQQLPKLEDLTLDLSPMPRYLSTGLVQLSPTIRSLELSCPNLSAVCLPSGLQSLTLRHSTTLSHWEFLSKLQGLWSLGVFHVIATEIRLDGLELLKNLTKLSICDCKFLERVDGISRLQKLQKFDLSLCPELVEIVDLPQPPDSLIHFGIRDCDTIWYLPPLSDNKTPGRLNLVVFECRMMRRNYDGPYDGYFQEEE